MTQEESHGEWEQLLSADYDRYVYFDGLNRFYVCQSTLMWRKHSVLRPMFSMVLS